MPKPHVYLPVGVMTILLAAAAPACVSAQGFYRYRTDVRAIDDRAYQFGFREGLRHGEDDARRGRRFDYSRHDDYRDADEGYRRGYGSRGAYRQEFRQGFIAGYSDGYRRYGRDGYRYPSWSDTRRYPSAPDYRYGYPRGGAYASPAWETGFNDGLEQGRNDAQRGRRFDPVRASRYRSGDHRYNNRYGSRDEYKREYRAAFQQGYDQGYRGYR